MRTGIYIKNKREEAGITRSQLARAAEVKRTTLIEMEDKNFDGKFKDVCRILIELDINITKAYIEMGNI